MFSSAFNSAKNSLASASEQALPILSSSTKAVTDSAKNSLASASEQALPILSSSTKAVTNTLNTAKETVKTDIIGVRKVQCENWVKNCQEENCLNENCPKGCKIIVDIQDSIYASKCEKCVGEKFFCSYCLKKTDFPLLGTETCSFLCPTHMEEEIDKAQEDMGRKLYEIYHTEGPYWLKLETNDFLKSHCAIVKHFLDKDAKLFLDEHHQKPTKVIEEDTNKTQSTTPSFSTVATVVTTATTAAGSGFKALKSEAANFNASLTLGSTLFEQISKEISKHKKKANMGTMEISSRLYYLACKEQLAIKMKETQDHLKFLTPEERETYEIDNKSTVAPQELLDYIARYTPIAQYMYMTKLPAPRHEEDWTSWYYRQLAKKEGYILLIAKNKSDQKFGTKLPAFSVLVKNNDNNNNKEEPGEVLVVVRGSSESIDWSINLNEGDPPPQYKYTYLKGESEEKVDGSVHKGIYQAAKTILVAYGIRKTVMDFYKKNYSVKVVGHSLGAGTAVLIAADLRMEALKIAGNTTPRVNAIVFSSPAIVSKDIADAFREDKFIINVIYGDDNVPRISQFALEQLMKIKIKEKNFSEKYKEWSKKDRQDYKDYMLCKGNSESEKSQSESESNTESKTESKECDCTEPETIRHYTPSPILHIYHDENGGCVAKIVGHKHSTFKTFCLSLTDNISNHLMIAYQQFLYDSKVQTKMNFPDTNISKEKVCEGKEELPFSDQIISEIKNFRATKPSEVTKVELKSIRNNENNTWEKCHICEEDPNWIYIFKSDSNRGSITHHCKACGEIVCTVCSPAGDSVPSGGFNQKMKLNDLKLPVPKSGLLAPQRICRACHLNFSKCLTDF